MEYVYPMVVDQVVQHFNQITFCVKAKQTVFVFETMYKFIEFNRFERPANIGFRYTVLESRLPKDNLKTIAHDSLYHITAH